MDVLIHAPGKSTHAALCGLFLILGGCSSSSEAQRTGNASIETPVEAVETQDAVALALEKGAALLDSGKNNLYSEDAPTGWVLPGFVQTYAGENFSTLVVTDKALLSTGDWEELQHQDSASFILMHVACGKLDEFALLGFDRADNIIIALWSLVGGSGTAVRHGTNGAVPSGLLRPKEFKKKRLFKGLPGSAPRGLELDPDGRFVVYVTKSPNQITTVFQLDCQDPNAIPVELLNSTQIPELSDIEHLEKFDHAALGRVYVCETSIVNRTRVIFVDANNDGVFDGAPIVGDDTLIDSLGLGNYEYWINLDH